MKKIALMANGERGIEIVRKIAENPAGSLPAAEIVSTKKARGVKTVKSLAEFTGKQFETYDGFVFAGALGICVRCVAPHIKNKNSDPAVVNVSEDGFFVQSVLSGHSGGANELARKIARILGAQPVITTATDSAGLWPLDIIGGRFGWKTETKNSGIKTIMSLLAEKRPFAVLFETRDRGTDYLERTMPGFAEIVSSEKNIPRKCEFLVAVTPFLKKTEIPSVFFRPKSLCLGLGSRRGIGKKQFLSSIEKEISARGFCFESIGRIASASVKRNEPAFIALAEKLGVQFAVYGEKTLAGIPKPNPSETVLRKTGTDGVCEPAALVLSGAEKLALEKTKITLPSGKQYTFAIAPEENSQRGGLVAIVGAGPGDPRLITLAGRDLIRRADLILYAASLVPEEITEAAKTGAVVKNSAVMTLERQTALMEKFYKKGALIVRLHSGDPSIYGATGEQIEIFNKKGMKFIIVPGVSSFQAAAARLGTELTAPEISQSIILTRGEGKTPMPERERISEMAKHRSTMCVFLSAKTAGGIQKRLLEHYDPETPVAILYRVTWKDEKIWRGKLKNLAETVRKNKLTRTVLIVVGDALKKTGTRSRLYHPEWKHLFRANAEKETA